MKEKTLPKSLRKYIRKEKARIRRQFSNIEEQKKQIQILYEKIKTNFLKTNKIERVH